MPFVNIKLAGQITDEKKKELIIATAEMLETILGKPKDSTYTVIDEVNPNNWGKGDESIAEIRAKNT